MPMVTAVARQMLPMQQPHLRSEQIESSAFQILYSAVRTDGRTYLTMSDAAGAKKLAELMIG